MLIFIFIISINGIGIRVFIRIFKPRIF